MFLFISGGEIFVILLVVVMVFGADKLPEIARELGKGMRQIKNATNDIKREIQNSADKNDLDIDVVAKIRNEVNRVKDNFDDFSNPIKKVQNDLEKSINPIRDAEGNLVSYFNKPKDAKNTTADISTEITADSSTTAVENKDVTEATSTSTEEVKDPIEEQNGTVKREK
ncbi:MAG: Sec-independent protein translocase subunit TatA/TatB [Lutibacter sp.]